MLQISNQGAKVVKKTILASTYAYYYCRRIIDPDYEIELETGVIISKLIMPRKEWEDLSFPQRPF